MNSYQDLLVNSITVLSESQSNSTCSGAVTVNGGVGIKGNLYVGGCIVGNNINNGGNGDNSTVNFTSIGSNMLPTMNNCFNIGSSEKRWKNIYLSDTVFCNKLDVNSINSCNTISINTDVCINGNLNVTGSINGNNCNDDSSNNNCDNECNSNSYLFNNKTLTIGMCSNNQSDANGSGLLINIGDDTKHLLWYKGNSNQCSSFEFDDNLTIKGNLIIEGCIQSSTCNNNNFNIISNDLIPLCSNTYNIGSDTKKWKKLYLSESLQIGVNHDFVNIDSSNKIMTINGSTNNNNPIYGNLLNITFNGCTNKDAHILRLSHNSGIKGGSKIEFDIDSINSSTIGANFIDNKHTFVMSVYDSEASLNKEILYLNDTSTIITTNTYIDKSINVNNNLRYEKNLIHSTEVSNTNGAVIDENKTFTEITINENYKEINFSYDPNKLEPGQIKYFIVTDITVPDCTCDTPHYKVFINDLIGGTAIILSSLGQSVGLVWTSQNKWLVFSGIACIVV